MIKEVVLFFTYILMVMGYNTNQWDLFIGLKKQYKSLDELKQRYDVFLNNLQIIEEHNKNNNLFYLGINEYSDLTTIEFYMKNYNLYHKDFNDTTCTDFSMEKNDVPHVVDWRNKNAVTKVKKQGKCGSCWAFVTSGMVEGAWAIKTGMLYDLSEQQLIDCSWPYKTRGCHGGDKDNALKYVIDNDGLCSDEEYPYIEDKGRCNNKCNRVAKIKKCVQVSKHNEQALKEAVSNAPVGVSIAADPKIFHLYKGGIIPKSKCGVNLNHAVLIVGYGNENGIDYWLIKNSWGETWGDNGYAKIERGSGTNEIGACGITSKPFYAVV